ncbi:cupin domain-containing protein [Metabacillus litoralis]|uniref:cupin domain-containing protein n=1 Tax=Metabacillus litoralis TaxID=152268 RepID=UPI001CFED2D7|nr:cupin domain-containing protein [Metabacillus litoralis]
MSKLYYVPNSYQTLYYGIDNRQNFNSNLDPRVPQTDENQSENVLLSVMKREATAIEFYRKLANDTPNETHKNEILQAIERKKATLTQFTNLYFNITGKQPLYNTDEITYHSYQEGLQRAFNLEIEGYENDRRNYFHVHQPQIHHMLMWALAGEQENAARFGLLNEDVRNHLTDYGAKPFVIDIEKATKQNNTFRTALWTGKHLQLTLMDIKAGEEIGLEIHPNLDQFLRIEQGQGIVKMGDSKNRLDFQKKVFEDYAIIIPAGKWHNLINTGKQSLKLYSIYAPPQHPFGTVHETKEIAMAAEEEHNNN